MVGEITIHDTDRMHCLGKHKLNNNVLQPIIVKITSYKVRRSIFKTRNKLENITENSYKEETN